MTKWRLSVLACALVLLGPATLASSSGELSYSYLQGGWGSVDPDQGSETGTGPMFDVSYGVSNMFHLVGGYEDFDYDTIDTSMWQVGAGIHRTMGGNFDLVGEATYLDTEMSTIAGDASEDGMSLVGGARKALGQAWEVNGGIEYVDIGDFDDTLFGVNALYTMKERYAIEGGYKIGDNDTLHLGFRWTFGTR